MLKDLFNEDYRKSLLYLGRWVLLSIIGGTTGFAVVWSFNLLLSLLQRWLAGFPVPLPIWALGGALVVGSLWYRIDSDAKGEGGLAYIKGVEDNDGSYPLRTTLVKYAAAFFTLGTWGCGGVVGPLGRVSAGLSSSGAKRIFGGNSWADELRTAAICGFAGCVGAVFHASLGAGVFAVEFIQKQNMRYRDLFPSILASCLSVYLCQLSGFESFFHFHPRSLNFDPWIMGEALVVAIAAALLGRLFSGTYRGASIFLKRDFSDRRIWKVMIGTAIAAIPAFLINPALLGTSDGLLQGILGDHDVLYGNLPHFLPLALVAFILLLVKMTANCVTVGSGLSAGFTGPMSLVGMLLGVCAAAIFGVDPYSGNYYALLAAGFAGLLASSINVPIAASIMAVELFGLSYGLPAGIAAVFGFQINRHNTVYDMMRWENGRK